MLMWTGNRLIGSPGNSRGGSVRADTRTSSNDAGNGSVIQDTGADTRPDAAQGPVVAGTCHHGDPADDLGNVRDRARVPGPLVLGAQVPLPDAVLLAVRQR